MVQKQNCNGADNSRKQTVRIYATYSTLPGDTEQPSANDRTHNTESDIE
jgi:hypothetical protein